MAQCLGLIMAKRVGRPHSRNQRIGIRGHQPFYHHPSQPVSLYYNETGRKQISSQRGIEQEVYYTLQSYSLNLFMLRVSFLSIRLFLYDICMSTTIRQSRHEFRMRHLQVVHSPPIHGAPTQPGLEEIRSGGG